MSESAMPTLSELLRTFRIRAGLTQAALAEKAGLSEQAISVLERGTRSRPRIDTVRSLTTALALTPTEADQFLSVARGKAVAARRSSPATRPSAASGPAPTPWQLPPAAPDFTGRAAQIDAILSGLRNPTGLGAVGVVAVTGMGGIGKTTLAVQAAHKLTDSYPDGHLYLNLRGYGPGEPMSVADAQRHLLRSLGLDLRLLPEDVDGTAALLRSQLAGRRVLLLLDNAADASHVLPLLPGSAGSAAIITSRGSLVNLAGARQIHLDALSDSESIDLLSGVIGRSRVQAEPDAALALATYSGRLPLAVRLLGGRLATRPTWPIQHLVSMLQDEESRLDSLGSDETSVRASIASSVRFLESSDRELDRQAARSLPLLSVPDGSDLLTAVAARLLDLPVRRTGPILERLVDLSLLESVAPERYRFHDLIRAYARELAEQTLTPTERDEGLARVLRFYVAAGWACHALTHPTSPRLPLATIRDDGVTPFRGREAAQRWLDDEQRNLIDRFRQIKHSSLADSADLPELALAMFGYYESRRRWLDMREIGKGAVAGALAHQRRAVAAWLQHDAAIPEAENGDIATAADWIATALTMFREIGDLSGQARCCSSLAYLLGVLDRIDEALEYGEEALSLSRSIQDDTLEGVSLTAVGGLYNRRGDFERADRAFADAIALAVRSDDTRSTFKRYLNSALSHLRVGRYHDAALQAATSLGVAEQIRDEVAQAEAHHLMALALAAQGDYEAARDSTGTALHFAARARDAIREGRLHLDLARINAARGDSSEALGNLGDAIAKLHGLSAIHEADARDLQDQLRQGKPYTFTLTVHYL
ncbi:XRE family transcriptional regulator [Kribbella sindirgiensis]|uniref:Helix-turn-helix domain-containing protein n=1 Tax=Kribbella sindirgiensis TaxID=1124744 RepID=A0A4R0J2H9_9ACTN|nr:XRE family transcriptional regulator [Kribbella sindirgiensis]TCC39264.1 helix-turn-helix domain-containing protein [Kribbella sindirgiensis]